MVETNAILPTHRTRLIIFYWTLKLGWLNCLEHCTRKVEIYDQKKKKKSEETKSAANVN